MDTSAAVLFPLLAWLSSGLAAVALTPKNLTARALFLAGTLLTSSWLLESSAGDMAGDTAAGALLRVGADALFLGGLAAVVAILATFPNGAFGRKWHRAVVVVLAALSVLGPSAQLLGAESLRIGADEMTSEPNTMAVEGFGVFGAVGNLVIDSEPVWILIGVAILVVRWGQAAGTDRRELSRPLLSLALLAGMLVVVALSSLTGVTLPVAIFDPLFLVALAIFPVVLLLGISRRTRGMERELAASRARLIGAEDEVRRTIERDLHDGVQQQLVAILSLTELAARQVRGNPERADATVREVRTQVQATIIELRELVYGIRPPVLEDSGVAAALDSRLARLPAEVTMDVGSVRHRRWPPETEAAAYFVVCEAVTNALKHAPGSPVRIRLMGDHGHLAVEIDDRGPGIGASVAHGRGLAGLRDRVDSLGGSFSVGDDPTGGTVVRARFPAAPVLQ